MPVTLEIPDDRMAQVGLTLRRAANEFHGALARNPEDSSAPAWRASAQWFDALAQRLIDAQIAAKGAGDDPAESVAKLRIAELEACVAAIKEQVDCSDSFNTPSVRVNDKCWSKTGCEPWYMQNHIIRRLAEGAIERRD